jgi:hypothetical protein
MYRTLLTHKAAAPVIEQMYCQVASNSMKKEMLYEFYAGDLAAVSYRIIILIYFPLSENFCNK